MTCTHPHQTYVEGVWYCNDCDKNPNEKRLRPMTDYEKLKIGWYRSEKKWQDNIRSRRIVTDEYGNKVTMSNQGVLPIQPKKYWQGKVKT